MCDCWPELPNSALSLLMISFQGQIFTLIKRVLPPQLGEQWRNYPQISLRPKRLFGESSKLKAEDREKGLGVENLPTVLA